MDRTPDNRSAPAAQPRGAARPRAKPSADELARLETRYEAERTLGWLFFDVHRLFTRAFDRRVTGDLPTRAQFRVLMLVRRHGGLTQSALADQLDMEKAPLGRLIDKLEAGGWIVRRPDPSDRRVNRITATDRIDPYIAEVYATVGAMFADALKGLKRADVAELIARLEQIKQNLIAAETGGKR